MTEKNLKELLKQLNIGQNISYAEIKELLDAKLSEYLDRQDDKAEGMVSEIQDAWDYVDDLIKNMGSGIALYEAEEPETINKDLLKETARNKKKEVENSSFDTNAGSLGNSNSNVGSNTQSVQNVRINTKGKEWFYSINGDKNVDSMFELAEIDLKMGDYNHALSVFDTILNIEMTNAGAYMGKVLATYQLKETKELMTCSKKGIEQDYNLKRVEVCGSDRQKKIIQDVLEQRNKHMFSTIFGEILGKGQNEKKDNLHTESKERKLQTRTDKEVYEEALRLIGTPNKAKGVDMMRKLAESGYRDAQYQMGELYRKGKQVTKDNKTAMEWYKKAANQGQVNAQYNLGLMYENGKGVEQNIVFAAEWCQKAAEQGYAEAQYELSLKYLNKNRGVERNEYTAFEWCQKAAKQGYVEAEDLLGMMYDHGWGVEKNERTAIEWYQKAAKQGKIAAMVKLEKKGLR